MTAPTHDEVRALILSIGLSHAKIAEKLEVSKETVDSWTAGPHAKGHRKMPASMFKFVKIVFRK